MARPPRFLTCLAAAVLGLAASCAHAQPTEGRTPRSDERSPMSTDTKIVTEEDFLASLEPGESVEVKVLGPSQPSFLKQASCGYFEWSYGQREGEQLVSYSVAYASTAKVVLAAGGARVELEPRRLRLYLQPSFQRSYTRHDAKVPEVVAQYLTEHPSAWAGEYCLEVGKSYFAAAHDDTYKLPPEGPGQPPRKGTRRVLRVSDAPFKGGEPQGELTPGFRGWTY